MLGQTQKYTTERCESSYQAETPAALAQIEADLTRQLQKLPIGSTEARKLFVVRERVRQNLAISFPEFGSLARERYGVD